MSAPVAALAPQPVARPERVAGQVSGRGHAPSALGLHFPQAQYVTISDFQRSQERMPKMRTIHHGIDFNQYRSSESKREHLAFIGRIAPVKGVHLAIEVAKKSGVPLKIAGEVQPMFQEYFDREVKPHLDGKGAKNICNRGRGGAGVQLEITEGLRRTFFRQLSPRSERQHTTPAFERFGGRSVGMSRLSLPVPP